DLLSKAWEKEISDMYIEIEKKEISLKNEEILLTKDMYNERRGLLDKEWVSIREYQQKVFGFEGLYFLKKKELIEPIQDIIFESIEKIAKKNRLQIVFDKSSEPILLYTNPIHDYTDYVLEDLGLNKKNN
ncbi:MAG: OmpH family outer membrane protein, partial [Bacteroidota bacterium]|nr:OmpH family outer membrane protein [Bacteroidota bacterium]